MNRTQLCAMALCLLSLTACANKTDSTGNNDMPTAAAAPRPAPASYGVVQAIDQVQRQEVGVGAMGAMAAGATAAGSPTDRVYRVTLKMDDGSTQTVVLESMPTYKVSDRVRYSDGTVQAY